jgi:hypothetical protein
MKGATVEIRILHRRGTLPVIAGVVAFGGGGSAIAATRNGEGGRAACAGRARSAHARSVIRKPLASLCAAELAALARARTAISAEAVSIATPILERAVDAGTITSAQRSSFLALLRSSCGPGAGPDGTWTGVSAASRPRNAAEPDAAAAAVLRSVEIAIQARVSSIATPVLDAAVAAGTIDAAQRAGLMSLLEGGPD